MQNGSVADLELIARQIRGKIIELSYQCRTPHLGSALSCVDILVASYWKALNIDVTQPESPNRDRFILSKGHAALALYTTFAYRGFFPKTLLNSYAQHGSRLEEHPGYQCVPGVEATSGSLGHGLSLGIGMALAGRLHGYSYRVFVVISDGECNEGSVWEAAMFAPAHSLDHLVTVIDFNRWQATGRSCEVTALMPLKQKWESFGWSVYEVDGHDMQALCDTLRSVPDGSGKPVAIIAHTVKGKGISFMEDDNNWHYRIPTAADVQTAHQELGLL